MKKITLFLSMLAITSISIAQNNPCPDIQSHGIITESQIGTTCIKKVYVNASGDVASPKGLNIQVFMGTIAGVLLADVCYIVPANTLLNYYETPLFTVPCNATITYVITRYTASNGLCQGGTCGQTITAEGGALPVSLSSFYANRKNGDVSVTWKSENETNSKEYIIQRKTSGEWVDVATVVSANRATGSSYSYVDNNSNKGISQYRLKMVDFAASFTNSEIRTVKGNGSVSDFTIFPNPSTGNTKVTVMDITEATDVQLVDNSGRVLKNIGMKNSTTVDLPNLQRGMYMIRILNKTTGESLTKKLTVVN